VGYCILAGFVAVIALVIWADIKWPREKGGSTWRE